MRFSFFLFILVQTKVDPLTIGEHWTHCINYHPPTYTPFWRVLGKVGGQDLVCRLHIVQRTRSQTTQNNFEPQKLFTKLFLTLVFLVFIFFGPTFFWNSKLLRTQLFWHLNLYLRENGLLLKWCCYKKNYDTYYRSARLRVLTILNNFEWFLCSEAAPISGFVRSFVSFVSFVRQKKLLGHFYAM